MKQQPVDILVLHHVADELGAVGAEASQCVVQVVDGEHDATVAQGVHRKVLRVGTDRRGPLELRELEPAVAVGRTQHRDLVLRAIDSDHAVGPLSLDLHSPLQLHPELDEERDGRIEVLDHHEDVVHAQETHRRHRVAPNGSADATA